MSVEGIPQRDVVVTFNQHFASYNAGESASFTEDEAQRLADLGVTGDASPPPTDPPVNVDVPHVSQTGGVLNCTMGNWTGEPTSYSYYWKVDGASVGTDAPDYTVTPEDVGKSATCQVQAMNAFGAAGSPVSNAVVIT